MGFVMEFAENICKNPIVNIMAAHRKICVILSGVKRSRTRKAGGARAPGSPHGYDVCTYPPVRETAGLPYRFEGNARLIFTQAPSVTAAQK